MYIICIVFVGVVQRRKFPSRLILMDETVHIFTKIVLYWNNPIYDQHLGRFCAQEAI